MADLANWEHPHAVLAGIQALRGEPEAAVASLRQAMSRGYRVYQHIRVDPLLETLRGRADFEQLMPELQSELAAQRERVLKEPAST